MAAPHSKSRAPGHGLGVGGLAVRPGPRACIPSLQVGIKWTRLPVVVVRLLGERCCHDLAYRPGHADAMLCRLVARHCCVIAGAGERGLADVLGLEFQPAPYVLSAVLTCGKLVPARRRPAGIHHRCGSGQLVSRSIRRGTPMILRAVEQAGRPNRTAPRTNRAMPARCAARVARR
jgi:hypothetical protein